ncbi:MAG TPA: DUF2786 domain-containing protein [Pseudonocardia sp.]|nr:DUF2786 domain-containing protein [Pseudonocardia sp.]
MGIDKLDTVRKLLAKADGAATPAEAEVYTAKAVELMARHGIDEALLGAAAPHCDEVATCRIPVADPYSAGKARLLAWTASALRCRAVLHEAGGGRVAAVTVLGFASDRAWVELLYTSLLLQASAQLARQRPAWVGESVAAYRRSWLHGFAVRVHQRLVEAEARAAESAAAARASPSAGPSAGPSVALVLADRRARVDRAYAEEFPQIGRARQTRLSGSGHAAGAQAGARADLGGRAVRPTAWQALDG